MASALWVLGAITVISIFHPIALPLVFHSSHVDHLTAFYIATFLVMAALPQIPATQLSLGLATFAFLLEMVRIYLFFHRADGPEDLICDLAGVLLAAGPTFLYRYRRYRGGFPPEPPAA